jgi:hypothetical protein
VSSPEWGGEVPYSGPPPWGPPQPQWAQPQWAPPQWAPPPYGPPQPAWGWGPYPPQPLRPRRPGPVIAAAVLGFVSAALVVVGTVYAMALSALLSFSRGPDAGMGPGLALLQLAVAGLLVLGGLRALHRDRRWLLGATAGQLALSAWWFLILDDVLPATVGDGVLVLPLLYGALAAVAAGLTFLPEARAWAARPRTVGPPAPPYAGG